MWSIKYKIDRCNGCGDDSFPHKALGLCRPCYEKSKGYQWQKDYAKNNRTKVATHHKKWAAANPAAFKRSKKRWQSNNGAKQSQYSRNWRARNKAPFCAICGEDRVAEWCHIIPARESGPVVHWNLIPLCPTHHACFDREKLTADELSIIQPLIDEAKNKFSNLK